MASSWCEQSGVWQYIEIDGKTHVVCFTRDSAESWKVHLTDLVEIWTETLTRETLFRRCQVLNPLLNLEAFDWKEMVMDMLNDIPNHVVEASVNLIKLQKAKSFIKLKFSLDLVKGTARQFWENITMPLCSSSIELIRQREILLDLMRQKDEEIAEYKASGAELIRKYIATKPFSEELFQNDAAPIAKAEFAKAFQSVLRFYNAMNLPKLRTKIESEVSPNTASDDISKIEETVFPDLEEEFVQNVKVDKNEQSSSSKDAKYERQISPSTSKEPILKLSSTSHTIQKSLRKNKKTLSDFIL